MAKKAAHRKAKTTEYQHFVLHGNHSKEKVFIYVAVALGIGLALGILLQAFITTP